MIRLRLILISILGLTHAYTQDINIDHFLSALAQVETGVTRTGIGEIHGRWSLGKDGEVSCFQISPAVLSDLGISRHSSRIHRDPVYAESIARLWLARIMGGNGDWHVAAATWNAGRRGRQSRQAQDYADRVVNLAQQLAKESAQ